VVLFHYSALNPRGKKTFGVVNAASIEEAKNRLCKQNVLVITLTPYKEQAASQTLSSGLFSHLTRDLYILLQAGLPLYESLVTLKEKYLGTQAHMLLLNLCEKVKQGQLLSEALACYSKIFDNVYVSMVKAGEESGSLTDSFKELSKLIRRAQEMRKKITTAMIYPIFLGSFALVVIGALLFFLIPSMQDLFEGRAIHPLTQTVLSISAFLNKNVAWISSSFGAVACVLAFFIRHKTGKELIQKLSLHIPIIDSLTTKAVMMRFCRVFSVLIRGGVSLLDALRLSKCVMQNSDFERVITQAETTILEGGKLSKELVKYPIIPQLVIRIVSLAEDSGNMGKLMHHIAEIYEQDLERSLNRLTSFLQPVILLFLGFVVAIILLAVLLPLTDVSSIT